MANKEKILIIHDTSYAEINETFQNWLLEFYINLKSASDKISTKSQNFTLSRDLLENNEQIPELNLAEYDFYLIMIHEELGRSKNLKKQFDQLLSYLKTLPAPVQANKTGFIFIGEFPLDHEILEIQIEKIVKFYSQESFSYYNKTKLISPKSREYWKKIFDILDLISDRVDLRREIRPTNRKPTVIYIGQATPDLESHREILMKELSKKGIEVLPESKDIYRSDIDHESLIDVLEYADMIIQLIGGKSGQPVGTTKITEVEREFQVITDFISGKTRRTLGTDKLHSWVIWMPGSISAYDKLQENFIAKIKRQLGYTTWDTELITGTFEQLKEFIFNALKTRITYSMDMPDSGLQNYVYLIHEKSVYQEALDISLRLKSYPLHIQLTHDLYLKPNFIQAHKETLQKCDAVLIYYGLDNVSWFESTVMEVIKIGKVQRMKPLHFQAVIYNPEFKYNLPDYKEFIYLPSNELEGQDFFNKYLKKMIS